MTALAGPPRVQLREAFVLVRTAGRGEFDTS